jgi:hypothetical protein
VRVVVTDGRSFVMEQDLNTALEKLVSGKGIPAAAQGIPGLPPIMPIP